MTDRRAERETLAAQTLAPRDPSSGALIPGLQPSTTYERAADNSYPLGRAYARADNPTFDAAADLLSALESGADTLLFSSGMSAATALFLALEPGDHVVAPRTMYWGLRAWLTGFRRLRASPTGA